MVNVVFNQKLPVNTRLQVRLPQTKSPQHITASHTHLGIKEVDTLEFLLKRFDQIFYEAFFYETFFYETFFYETFLRVGIFSLSVSPNLCIFKMCSQILKSVR